MIFNYILYGGLALMVAYLWLSYLRLVDVFRPDSWVRIGLSFIAGCFSVVPVLALDVAFGDIIPKTGWWGQLLFYVFEVGFVEEASKLLLAFVVLKLFLKDKEPVDYLVHGAAVAAGFAAVENVLYIDMYGVDVIRGRAPIAAFIHMSLASMPMYAYAKSKFMPGGVNRYLMAFAAFAAAVVIHGLFDFFLSVPRGGVIFGFVIYFLMVELWLTQINNLLNLSPHFNKAVVPSFKRVQRLLIFGFLGLMFGEIISGTMSGNEDFRLFEYLLRFVFLTILPVLLIMSKFSHLRLIPGKIFPLFFQFVSAFRVGGFRPNRANSPYTSPFEDLRIDSYDEQEITRMLGNVVTLVERNVETPATATGLLADKFWVQEDEVLFEFVPSDPQYFEGFRPDIWLLKAKTQGDTLYDGYQEVLVYLIPEGVQVRRHSSMAEFEPRARCYIQPLEE